MLREVGVKNFDLVEALVPSDKEFCAKFNVPKAKLDKLKASKPFREEKDHLWVYSTGSGAQVK